MAEATRALSRRQFLGNTAATTVAAVSVPVLATVPAQASPDWDALRDALDLAADAVDAAFDAHTASKAGFQAWNDRNPPFREAGAQARRDWQRRSERALKDSGMSRTAKRLKDAEEAHARACCEVAKTPATTFADVKQKASLALLCESPAGYIRAAVLRDLIRLT